MIEQFLNGTSARFYFWLWIKSFWQLNAERPLQCWTVLNSTPPAVCWTGEGVKWRILGGMSVIVTVTVSAHPPDRLHLSSLFYSVSLLWLTCFSHSPSSFIRVNLLPLYLPVSLTHFTDYQLSVWSSSFSPLFQIISLLNVFTPQKSLEEFQDV